VKRNITVMPIMSRSRYLRLGYVLYPGYESMYADNDFTEHAQLDGLFVDAQDLPEFPHRHPFWTNAPMDTQYEAQNSPKAYQLGANLLNIRRATGFGSKPITQPEPQSNRQTIAVCLPGESFSTAWVSAWTELFVNLFSRYNVIPIFCFSSNVHATRGTLVNQIREICKGDGHNPIPDYVLWIDDDNPVMFAHFSQLINDLESMPEADGVAGWCWIHDQANSRYVSSCGLLNDNGMCTNYLQETFAESDYDLIPIEFTGFPLFLMRTRALDLGPFPFAPILKPEHPYGAMSEDTAYCQRAKDAGLKFYVDRRVKVDHLKLGPLGPLILPKNPIHDPSLPAAETNPVMTER
jgi:hypothetical protein